MKTRSARGRRGRQLLVAFALTGLCLCGCSSRSQHGSTGRSLNEEECLIGTDLPRRQGQIGITLLDPVYPAHAPVPYNISEEIIFRQCYETLINLSCDGLPEPGLAIDWRFEGDACRLMFTLRPDGYFEDGSPVTAGAVVAAWELSRRNCTRTVAEFPWALIDSVTSDGHHNRQLSVYLSKPIDGAELLFSHPALAVYKPVASARWPLGSGVFRVIDSENDGVVTCVANRFHRQIRDGSSVRSMLVFSVFPGADPRDVFSAASDAMISGDSRLIDYVSRLDGYAIEPLPYRRLYLLVSPILSRISPDAIHNGQLGMATIEEALGEELTTLRNELAQLVVISDAVPADRISCTTQAMPLDNLEFSQVEAVPEPVRLVSDSDVASRLVVYPATDEDARLLAERLVGLASPIHLQRSVSAGNRIAKLLQLLFGQSAREPAGAVRAIGLTDNEFNSRLAQGLNDAYIVPLTCRFDHPSLNNFLFNESLDWSDWKRSIAGNDAMIPLVMSRNYLVSRQQLTGIATGFDGTVLFAGAGWAEEALP